MSAVTLKPTPGFCIKSATVHDNNHGAKGLKVFINIAWDSQVPAPPPATDDVVKRAMEGQDDGWYVPVLVSEPRQDVDKAGKPSLVIDCVYNKSLKSRVLRDADFKLFLIELALQRIEVQCGVVLSRTIATPNIASKGKLAPRTVTLPAIPQPNDKPKPFIEEVPESTPSFWTWSKEGDRLQVSIPTPNITPTLIKDATLDLEARRIIISIPTLPTLDIDLDLSDAELVSKHPQSDVLSLKRQRPFLVDEASSEWRVKDRLLVLRT